MSKKAIFTSIIVIAVFRPLMYYIIPVIDVKEVIYVLLARSWADSIIALLIFAAAFLYLTKLTTSATMIKESPVDWVILGFLAISVLSLSYTVNRNVSIRTLLLLFSYILFFFLIFQALTKNEVTSFAGLLVGLGTVIALHAIFEYFYLYRYMGTHLDLTFVKSAAREMLSLRRVGSVFGWPNRLAGFLGMIIPVSIGLALYENRVKVRFLLIICTLIMFMGMLFTFSIGGWIALVGALVIFVAIVIFRLTHKDSKQIIARRKLVIGIGAFLLILAFAAVAWLIIEKRATPITWGAIKSRWAYLKGAWGVVKDNLVLGTGLGTFGLVYPRYMPTGEGFESWHVHNSYLEIWSELGIAGLVLFLLFIWKAIRKGFKSFFNAQNSKSWFLLSGLITGITAFLIHNIIEFTFYCPDVTLYWWFLSGLFFVYTNEAEESSPQAYNFVNKPRGRILFLAMIVSSLLWSTMALGNNFVSDLYYSGAIKAIKDGELPKAITEYKKAIARNPQDSRYHNSLAQAYWLAARMQSNRSQFLHLAMDEIKCSLELNPYDSFGYAYLAQLYLHFGNIDGAIDSYKKAIFYRPNVEGYHLQLNSLYLELERQKRELK